MGNHDDDSLVEVPVVLVLSREVVRRMRKLSETNRLSFQNMASLAVEVGFDKCGECIPAYPTAHGQRVGVYPKKPTAALSSLPGQLLTAEEKDRFNVDGPSEPIQAKEAMFRAGEKALREYSRGQAPRTEGSAASGPHPGTERPRGQVPRRRLRGSPLRRYPRT